MKFIICFFLFFLLVTLSNALRITKLDHHVDHDLRRERLSSSVPDYTKSSPLVKKDATEDDNNNLPSFTKIDNDHFQNQLQVHLINRFNKYSDLPGHPYNPHKCRHHLRLIAYYPRFIDRDAPFPRNLLKGQDDHELHMLDQFTRPHYIILRHRHHHHRRDHHDVKDDQTYEEKTEMVEDQHEESEQKDKEHEHESRKKDLLIKLRKFLPYF